MTVQEVQEMCGRHVLVYAVNHQVCAGDITFIRKGGMAGIELRVGNSTRFLNLDSLLYMIEVPNCIASAEY